MYVAWGRKGRRRGNRGAYMCVCVNVGEVIEGDTLNRYMLTAAEYLLHCLEFCNLSQHTSISPSYHQHLGRWGGGKEGMREKGGR